LFFKLYLLNIYFR